MTSLKTSIKTITYLSDTGCLEIQGASLHRYNQFSLYQTDILLKKRRVLEHGTEAMNIVDRNTLCFLHEDICRENQAEEIKGLCAYKGRARFRCTILDIIPATNTRDALITLLA
ncbi:TPA: hypothetical protein HNC59_26425 [Escherichia coli]|nr:hypothetical protein [Escherichia coli]HAJ6889655.1 hypothetical protein [Escherichia coli]